MRKIQAGKKSHMILITSIPFVSFFFVLTFASLSVVSLASTTCNPCYVGNCQCAITDCSSGTFGVYATTDCSGFPTIAYTSFSGSSVAWSPNSTGSYYSRVFCESGGAVCTAIQASANPSSTTTTSTQTTVFGQFKYSEVLIFIIIVVVVLVCLIGFLVYSKSKRQEKNDVPTNSVIGMRELDLS